MSSWSWLLKLSTSSFASLYSSLLMPVSFSYLSRFSFAWEISFSRASIFSSSFAIFFSRSEAGRGAEGGEEEEEDDEEDDKEDEDDDMEDAGAEEEEEEEEEEEDEGGSSFFSLFKDDIVSFVCVNGKEGEQGMKKREEEGGRR